MEEIEIDLFSVERLTDYVFLDELVSRCHRLLVERIFFAEGCSIVLSCTDNLNPNAAAMDAAIHLQHFNTGAYIDAVARLWSEASIYLRLFGLVVLEIIDKDVEKWAEAMNEQHVDVPASGLSLPVAVVPLTCLEGRLVYAPNRKTGEGPWFFEPRDDGSNGRRKRRRCVVYTDPAHPTKPPLSRSALDRAFTHGVRALHLGMAQPQDEDLPLGMRGAVAFTLYSPYWSAQRASKQLDEIRENILDAEHKLSQGLLVYPRRPMREIAPELIGPGAMYASGSVQEAMALQFQDIAQRAYERGLDDMRMKQRGGPAHTVRGAGGEPMTKSEAMRECHGRPYWTDEYIHVSDEFNGVNVISPAYKADVTVWEDRYAQRIARLFDLPVEIVVGNLTGGDETTLLDTVRPVLQQQRRRASAFYTWLYDQTYAKEDLGVLNKTLEARTPTELVHLSQFVAAVDRPPQAEQTGPRLRDLLLGEASPLEASGSSAGPGAGKQAPKHVAIPSVERVRLGIVDLIGNKRRLVAFLIFHADLISSATAVANAVGPRGGTTTAGRYATGGGGASGGGAAPIAVLEHLLRAADAGFVTTVEYRNTLTMLTGVRLDAEAAEIEKMIAAREAAAAPAVNAQKPAKRAKAGGSAKADAKPKSKKRKRSEKKDDDSSSSSSSQAPRKRERKD